MKKVFGAFVKKIERKIEGYMVHKTQAERRREMFGHDPLITR